MQSLRINRKKWTIRSGHLLITSSSIPKPHAPPGRSGYRLGLHSKMEPKRSLNRTWTTSTMLHGLHTFATKRTRIDWLAVANVFPGGPQFNTRRSSDSPASNKQPLLNVFTMQSSIFYYFFFFWVFQCMFLFGNVISYIRDCTAFF